MSFNPSYYGSAINSLYAQTGGFVTQSAQPKLVIIGNQIFIVEERPPVVQSRIVYVPVLPPSYSSSYFSAKSSSSTKSYKPTCPPPPMSYSRSK